MKIKLGVDTFIWSEMFSEKDLWIIEKAKQLGFSPLDIAVAKPEAFPLDAVKAESERVGMEILTTTTLNKTTNIIAADPEIRAAGVKSLKRLVDINIELGAKILGGVNYAGWGCLSGSPRTEEEWDRSVSAMREAAEYAKERSDMIIAVEPVNRFETHFLNIAEDAVRTCGKGYLGYVHVCESNRGIPGTGLVPWKELFQSLEEIGYEGPMVIESFDPGFVELNRLCAIWRKFAESGEALAVEGKKNLEAIAGGM